MYKNIIYLFYPFLVFACNAKVGVIKNDSCKLNTINIQDIEILKCHFGENKEEVKKKIKKIIIEEKENQNEMEGTIETAFVLKDGQISFLNNKLNSFTLNRKGTTCISIKGKSTLKVSDNLSVIEMVFPCSYSNYLKEQSNFIKIKIEDTENYLIFEIRDSKIFSLYTWDDL